SLAAAHKRSRARSVSAAVSTLGMTQRPSSSSWRFLSSWVIAASPSRRRLAVDQAKPFRPVAQQHQHVVGCELPDGGIERQEPVLLLAIDGPSVPGEDAGAPL